MFYFDKKGSYMTDQSGWIFQEDACYFDPKIGFKNELLAMEQPFIVTHLQVIRNYQNGVDQVELGAILADKMGVVLSEFLIRVDQLRISSRSTLEDDFDMEKKRIQLSLINREQALADFLDFIGHREVFFYEEINAISLLKKIYEPISIDWSKRSHDISCMVLLTSPEQTSDHRIDLLARQYRIADLNRNTIGVAKFLLNVLLNVRKISEVH